jgi:hypothetical protein
MGDASATDVKPLLIPSGLINGVTVDKDGNVVFNGNLVVLGDMPLRHVCANGYNLPRAN